MGDDKPYTGYRIVPCVKCGAAIGKPCTDDGVESDSYHAFRVRDWVLRKFIK